MYEAALSVRPRRSRCPVISGPSASHLPSGEEARSRLQPLVGRVVQYMCREPNLSEFPNHLPPGRLRCVEGNGTSTPLTSLGDTTAPPRMDHRKSEAHLRGCWEPLLCRRLLHAKATSLPLLDVPGPDSTPLKPLTSLVTGFPRTPDVWF